jgi:hypothetical protein
MRRRVPVRSGLLRKAIAMRYGKGRNVAKVTVGLLNRQYYTLDVGRKPYKRTNKNGTTFDVAGSPSMKTDGLGLHQVWEAHRQEILGILVEGMQKELFRQLGRASVTGKFRR